MEKFDIKKFEEKKINGEYNFILNDGTQVRQIENKNSKDYVEERKTASGMYTEIKLFFMGSGNLKTAGEKFYNFPVGKWKYFDEAGNLVKEPDWDTNYKFSVEDLAGKMEEMEIDIMHNTSGINVSRSSTGAPLYSVQYPVNPLNIYKLYSLKIDGITGKILEKKTVTTRN
ncbi:MAG: hypothetical protein ABI402_11155 [Ferruginibacter sp.]